VNVTRLALLALVLIACDPPTDIGNVCALPNPDGGPGLWISATSDNDDFFYNGTTECQNAVCLRPAGSPLDAGLGFCSNSCTPESPGNPNSTSPDCNGSSIPIVCRTVALDQQFITAILDEDGGAALLDEYLGGTTPPTLCTTPTSGS
jgi:hypothetical protein